MTGNAELEEGKLRHGENQRKRRGARKVETRARAIAGRRERPWEKSECGGGEKGSFSQKSPSNWEQGPAIKNKKSSKEELLFWGWGRVMIPTFWKHWTWVLQGYPVGDMVQPAVGHSSLEFGHAALTKGLATGYWSSLPWGRQEELKIRTGWSRTGTCTA